jgi:hypothetical protein
MKKTILTPGDGWVFVLSGGKSSRRKDLQEVYPGDPGALKMFDVAQIGKKRLVFCTDQTLAGTSTPLYLPAKGILNSAVKRKKPFRNAGSHVWIITKDHIESYHLSKDEGLSAGVTRREEEGWNGTVVISLPIGSDKAEPVICSHTLPKTIMHRSRLSGSRGNRSKRIVPALFLLLLLGLLQIRTRHLSREIRQNTTPETIRSVSGIPFRYKPPEPAYNNKSEGVWIPRDGIAEIGNNLSGNYSIQELSVSENGFSIFLRAPDPFSLIETFRENPGTAGIAYRKEGDLYIISAEGTW